MASTFGGIIAGALGGGANAVGQIAEGQIEKTNKVDLAKQISEIDEMKQQRLAQANETLRRSANAYDTTGEGGEQKLAFEGKKTAQANTAALEQSRAQIPIDAERTAAVGKATADVATASTIEQGSNPAFIKAVRALESAKESSSTRAGAALASAEAALKGEQLRDFKDLRNEYDAVKLLQNDASLNDEQRAREIAKHQQNIDLIKQKNTAGKGAADINGVAANAANLIKLADAAELNGDPVLAKQYRAQAAEMSTGAGAKKLPNSNIAGVGGAKAPPAVGAVVGGYTFKGGDPADKNNWSKSSSAPAAGEKPAASPKPASDAGGGYVPPEGTPAAETRKRSDAAKAAQEAEKQRKSDWGAAQAARATDALSSLDLKDKRAVREFQTSDLFDALTPQQKAKVAQAANSR
jgi:hypothetical protein